MILFYSDPHIGVNRRANTTDKSRKALARIVAHRPAAVIRDIAHANKASLVVCAGDLFDKFSNKEETILEARELVRCTDIVIAGNHDQINDSSKKSSLEVIESIFPSKTVISCHTGERLFHVEHHEETDTTLYLVPHHSTQGLMEETLEAVISAVEHDKSETIMLVAHCNFDIPQEISNDVTLNLSADDAQYLLEDIGIDYILLGHDHNCREMYDGRVRILGNTQPTSFSDIGNKFLTIWDGTEFVKLLIWSAETQYKELHVDKDWPVLSGDVEFVDVVGKIPPEKSTATVRRINELWDSYPNLLAIRNSTVIEEASSLTADEITELSSSTVYDLIEAHIINTDLHELWLEMTKDIQNAD